MARRNVRSAKIFEYANHDAADNGAGKRAEPANNRGGKRLHQHQVAHFHLHRLHRADQNAGSSGKAAGEAEDQRDHQRHIDTHQIGYVLVMGDGTNRQTSLGVPQKIMKPGHQQHRNDRRQHIAFRNLHISRETQSRDIVEIGTERLGLGAEEEIGCVDQRDRHAETADDHTHAGDCIATASARQPSIEDSFNRHPKKRREDHRANQRDRVGHTDIMRQHEPKKGAKHIHLTMREMHDVKAGIDQRDAQRHNAIDDTDGDAKNNESQQRVEIKCHYFHPP